jgi:hypothetical protein
LPASASFRIHLTVTLNRPKKLAIVSLKGSPITLTRNTTTLRPDQLPIPRADSRLNDLLNPIHVYGDEIKEVELQPQAISIYYHEQIPAGAIGMLIGRLHEIAPRALIDIQWPATRDWPLAAKRHAIETLRRYEAQTWTTPRSLLVTSDPPTRTNSRGKRGGRSGSGRRSNS